jgi:hypothetical protein
MLKPSFSASVNQIFANINNLKNTFYALPLPAYQIDYIEGRAGNKTTARSQLIAEAAAVKNIYSRVLAFFGAIAKQGFTGTIGPLDVISERLKVSTGGLGEPRSIRRALKGLEGLGWIERSHLPTNTHKETAKGWITLSVLRITFTYKLLHLFGLCDMSPISIHRPKRPPLLNRKAKAQEIIGGSLEPLAVSIVQTEKKESQLAPAGAHTSALTKSQNSHEWNEQELCHLKTAPAELTEDPEEPAEDPEEPAEEPETIICEASSSELTQSFVAAVEARLFSEYPEKAEILLNICKNQQNRLYPAAFPAIPFDLITWAISPWHIQRLMVAEYCGKACSFLNEINFHVDSVKKIFLFSQKYRKISFSDSIAYLCVSGKIKINEVSGSILADWPRPT